MSRLWLFGWLVVPAWLASACGDADEAPDACEVDVQLGALFAGGSRSEYLALSSLEENAAVGIEVDAGGGLPASLCSGVLIAPGWVASAKHCTGDGGDFGGTIAVGRDVTRPVWSVSMAGVVAHPDLDLALIELAVPVPDHMATPIAPLWEGAPGVGALVELSGWGLTEDGGVGQRRFAVEEVVEVDDREVTVDGMNLSGACTGDSGGPVLTRDVQGTPRAVGVLSRGSASCREIDKYLRLAAASDWVAEHTGLERTPARPAGCGQLPAEGRCYDGAAVWCEDGSLGAQACAEEEVCGWDEQAVGFRCVPSADDPCLGIGSQGMCAGDAALNCVRGELQETPCDTCAACQRSPTTGVASCAR